MSDDEGALRGDLALEAYEEAGKQHIFTSSAHVVKRFNRTLKNMTTERMKHLIRGFRLRGPNRPG